ncbi:hypothetical protein RFI_33030 [Reticulomyxa filosa]|uniref:Uncharacterized protein n=1 Tax=Reticulomyxa filosa TaxID=46433 RepID=X6LR98_RETFI|nr:hypothetical protein RFI_33030 [Reticulomyxa filosa]|eukprot:ETO04368.1 hypothetical protein RFI_33030 [Reticulomyxa filosa]
MDNNEEISSHFDSFHIRVNPSGDISGDLVYDEYCVHEGRPLLPIFAVTLKKITKNQAIETKEEDEPYSEKKFEELVASSIENSQKFIHKTVDLNDETKVKKTIDFVTKQAFQTQEFSIQNIEKGTLYGNMTQLLPNGDMANRQLDGQVVLKTQATLKNTLTEDIFYTGNDFVPMKVAATAASCTFVPAGNSNEKQTITQKKTLDDLFHDSSKKLSEKYFENIKNDEAMKELASFNRKDWSTIPSNVNFTTKGPIMSNCGAHFTGLLFARTFKSGYHSVPYVIDAYSEYVGQGEYPKNSQAFPKAVASSFDGIAIDPNTRVIIYELPNFQGKILLDVKGPKIIQNCNHKNSPHFSFTVTETWDDERQKTFPPSVREWSSSRIEPNLFQQHKNYKNKLVFNSSKSLTENHKNYPMRTYLNLQTIYWKLQIENGYYITKNCKQKKHCVREVISHQPMKGEKKEIVETSERYKKLTKEKHTQVKKKHPKKKELGKKRKSIKIKITTKKKNIDTILKTLAAIKTGLCTKFFLLFFYFYLKKKKTKMVINNNTYNK